jgi:Ca2+-binding RTX toxin-like protein
MHELGHSLGLKHGQEAGGPANITMTDGHDQMEYSVMTDHSYIGDTHLFLTNEPFGYAQSPMMYDIAGIQAIYGANFSGPANTVYSWSPTTGEEFINGVGQGVPGANRVFMTVWDGGGHATYDFSAYSTDLSIDLRPGAYSKISAAQLAYLGDGHYADGNVFNAIQYHDDPRSLIEVAIGGSGADRIIGNAADNILRGGRGADILTGGPGNDVFYFAKSDFQAGVSKTITDLSWGNGSGEHDRIRIDGIRWTDVTATLTGPVTDLSVAEGGGKHADILIDGRNTTPLQLEFGAHPTGSLLSLETSGYANVTMGYFDVANVKSWARHFDTYNAAGALSTELAFNHDGTSDTIHWDVSANRPWSEYTDHFTAAGQLQAQVNYNDDGSTDKLYWDVSGTRPWSEYKDHITAAGQLQAQVNYNDDGSTDKFRWDVLGNRPWSEHTTHLSPAGHAQWQDVSYRNATQAITGYADGLILSDPRVNDTYTGGGTNETFVFAPHFGKAVVTDFIAAGPRHDVLDIDHTVFHDFAHLRAATHQVGLDTVITADAADTITLLHVAMGSLTGTDFHFL